MKLRLKSNKFIRFNL